MLEKRFDRGRLGDSSVLSFVEGRRLKIWFRQLSESSSLSTGTTISKRARSRSDPDFDVAGDSVCLHAGHNRVLQIGVENLPWETAEELESLSRQRSSRLARTIG